jgi:ribonuclease Z
MSTRMVSQKIGSLEILGYSLAGEENVIAVPEMNVAFDFGRGPRELMSIDHVCLSHGHMDHAAGIAYYFSQRNFLGVAPGTVILHPSLIRPVERLMAVWAEIEGHPSPANLVPIEPDQEVSIRRDLFVRAFTVAHRAPSMGFAVLELRHKLRPEYAGLTGPQLVDLKNKGFQIDQRVEIPRIAYCGDTAGGAFLNRPDVKNAQIILIECTFFDEDHVHRARAGQHFHVKDLIEVLPGLNCPHIVITHVTRRTPLNVAKAILAKNLRKDVWERVTFLMDRPFKRWGDAGDRGRRGGRGDRVQGSGFGVQGAEPGPRKE